MRKTGILFAVAVTLAVLVAFAALPKLISSHMDHSANMPSYHTMSPLRLNRDSNRRTLTTLEKLAFLSYAQALDITPDQATMTEDALLESVYKHMSDYEAAGIFAWFEAVQMSIQPKLLYDPADSARNTVIWTVTLIGEKGESQQTLLLDVDDETGNILCIAYHVYGSFSMEGIWEKNKAVMECFTDLYFSQLGLQADINVSRTVAEYQEWDGGGTDVTYTFEDDTYGTVFIQFTVDGAGGLSTYFYA